MNRRYLNLTVRRMTASTRLLLGLVAVAVSSTVAAAVIVYWLQPMATWLMAIPLGAELLVGAIVWRSRPMADAATTEEPALRDRVANVDGLLRQVRLTFHADVAALVYLPPDAPESTALALVGPGPTTRNLETVARRTRWEALEGLVPGHRARIVSDAAEVRRVGASVGHPGMRAAMVLPLCRGLDVLGFLIVADRVGEPGHFTPVDLRVLETLAPFVLAGLEDGHLEESVIQARVLERQLVHRATHDILTGLANRTLLADQLSRRIDEEAAANLALLLIDVGHHEVIDDGSSDATVEEVLDQLMVIAAQRLVGSLRDGDLAARVGEHELAVIARVATDGGQEATRLGRRIVRSLSRAATVSGATLSLSPTVAVVLGRPFDDCADLLNAADLGLIAAKASARGRVELVTR